MSANEERPASSVSISIHISLGWGRQPTDLMRYLARRQRSEQRSQKRVASLNQSAFVQTTFGQTLSPAHMTFGAAKDTLGVKA